VYSQRPAARSSVARDVEGIAGTVQLHPAWAPNQPHRAEIAKLLVHRRSRRTGLATQLMQAIEDAARRAGFSLLTLDAKRGGAPVRDDNRALALVGSTGDAPDRVAVTAAVPRVAPDRRAI
jgi:GNAT superfamily N-acetyltransferase